MTDAVSDQSFRQSTGSALGLTDLLSDLTNSRGVKNILPKGVKNILPKGVKNTWKTT